MLLEHPVGVIAVQAECSAELAVSNCVFTVQLDKKRFPRLAVEVRSIGANLLFDVLR